MSEGDRLVRALLLSVALIVNVIAGVAGWAGWWQRSWALVGVAALLAAVGMTLLTLADRVRR